MIDDGRKGKRPQGPVEYDRLPWLGPYTGKVDHLRAHFQVWQDPRTTSFHQSVYGGLLIHVNFETCISEPCRDTLAGYADCGDTKVSECLADLTAWHYIEPVDGVALVRDGLCRCGCGSVVAVGRAFVDKAHQTAWMRDGGAFEIGTGKPTPYRILPLPPLPNASTRRTARPAPVHHTDGSEPVHHTDGSGAPVHHTDAPVHHTDGPVQQADGTRPPGGRKQEHKNLRTGTIEAATPPLPPAERPEGPPLKSGLEGSESQSFSDAHRLDRFYYACHRELGLDFADKLAVQDTADALQDLSPAITVEDFITVIRQLKAEPHEGRLGMGFVVHQVNHRLASVGAPQDEPW